MRKNKKKEKGQTLNDKTGRKPVRSEEPVLEEGELGANPEYISRAGRSKDRDAA